MKIRIADLHNDAITELAPARFRNYVAKAEKEGADTIFVSVWTTKMHEPISKLRIARQTLDAIKTRVKLLLHIEDAWFINESNIGEVIKIRPFSVGLVWNGNNDLAGGTYGDGHLTNLGTSIIERLIESDIKIDLAHLNRQSFFEVAKILQARGQKLLCTHTAFHEINSHPRNLDKNQIRTIVESGGIIGLAFVGEFLSQRGHAEIHDICKHIAYFIENLGDDNLCIGTDFFGTSNLPKGIRGYKSFTKLKEALVAYGLEDNTINKIFWENVNKL